MHGALPVGILPGEMERDVGTVDLFSPTCPGCPGEYVRLRYIQGFPESLSSAVDTLFKKWKQCGPQYLNKIGTELYQGGMLKIHNRNCILWL